MIKGKSGNSVWLAILATHWASSDIGKAVRGTVSLAQRWRDLLLPAVLLAGSLVALSVDFPISSWFPAGYCPGLFRACFELVEPFGNGLGVIVIAAPGVHVLTGSGRLRTLPRPCKDSAHKSSALRPYRH